MCPQREAFNENRTFTYALSNCRMYALECQHDQLPSTSNVIHTGTTALRTRRDPMASCYHLHSGDLTGSYSVQTITILPAASLEHYWHWYVTEKPRHGASTSSNLSRNDTRSNTSSTTGSSWVLNPCRSSAPTKTASLSPSQRVGHSSTIQRTTGILTRYRAFLASMRDPVCSAYAPALANSAIVNSLHVHFGIQQQELHTTNQPCPIQINPGLWHDDI